MDQKATADAADVHREEAARLCAELLKAEGNLQTMYGSVGAFESLVAAHHLLVDPSIFAALMSRAMRSVGRVARCSDDGTEHPLGTAFVVGGRWVLTNQHVVDAFTAAGQGRLIVRFDYFRKDSGITASVKQRLAGSPAPLAPDESGDLRDAPNELDYALLELEQPLDRPVLSGLRGGLAASETLFILQHADGEPLRMSAHVIEGFTATRMRYKATTSRGSSGAPCFDANWNLIGIHHFGAAHRFNQGVPIQAIRVDLSRAGFQLPMVAEPLREALLPPPHLTPSGDTTTGGESLPVSNKNEDARNEPSKWLRAPAGIMTVASCMILGVVAVAYNLSSKSGESEQAEDLGSAMTATSPTTPLTPAAPVDSSLSLSPSGTETEVARKFEVTQTKKTAPTGTVTPPCTVSISEASINGAGPKNFWLASCKCPTTWGSESRQLRVDDPKTAAQRAQDLYGASCK